MSICEHDRKVFGVFFNDRALINRNDLVNWDVGARAIDVILSSGSALGSPAEALCLNTENIYEIVAGVGE